MQEITMYNKILVPLDGSELSETVLQHVVELAKCNHSQVVLLRVVSQPVYESAYAEVTPASLLSDQGGNARAHAEGYLQRVAFDFFSPTMPVTYEVSGGPVADTILDYATGIGADLIAMSTHGRNGLARMVIGSVADEIVRRSHLPVLLVHPEH
jgi:nucleotide-binding universal stress UspA family protein